MATTEVQVDTVKNRMYVKLVGFFTEDDARLSFEKVKAGVDQLHPGFDLISDISEFKPAHPEVAKTITKAHQYQQAHGMGRVVRVVGEVIGQMQIERISQQDKIVAHVVRTFKEAEEWLDTN